MKFDDPGAYKSAAKRIANDKGLTPEDSATVALAFLHGVSQGLASSVFKDDAAYAAAFKAFVQHAKTSGLSGLEANAIVLAWALKNLQGAEIFRVPKGGPAA